MHPLSLSLPPQTQTKEVSLADRETPPTEQDAIDALNTLQTPYEVIEARRKAGIRPDASSVQEMKTYLRRIGYSVRPPSHNITYITYIAQ